MGNIIRGLLAIAASGLALQSIAEPSQQYTLDIERKSLKATLTELSKQTGLQVGLFAKTREQEKRLVGPLKGLYTIEAALTQVLGDSGLTFTRVNEITITVVSLDVHSSGLSPRSDAESDRLRSHKASFMSAVDTRFFGEDVPYVHLFARLANEEYEIPRTGSKYARTPVLQLEEVVVTGSHLRRAGETSAPVIVFDRQKIEQLGVSTVADILNYLPQQPSTNLANMRFPGGASFVQLRGLSWDSSLVLINGRRAVPSGPSVQYNAVDLNAIPLAAVERVEVLSDSASAIYGADAIGGVLNVILRSEFDQPVAGLHYGAARGGAEERRLWVGGGASGERVRASLTVDYFDRDVLMGDARDLFADQDYRRFGSIDRRSTFTNPANISSLSGANLPGLPSAFAVVPQGSTGVGLTPSDFLRTAGQLARMSASQLSSIIPKSERLSGIAFAEFEISTAATLFGEFLYVDRRNMALASPSSFPITVPANNPLNPFGTPVVANYRFNGVGPRRNIDKDESSRVVLGSRGTVGTWEWELSALGARNKGESWTENAVDPVRASLAIQATDPSATLNVFQDGPGGTDSLLASLVAVPTFRTNWSEAGQLTAFARGPLFAAPGGIVQTVIGAETRREKMHVELSAPGFSADRDVSAAFVEMRVPLLNKDMNVAGLQSLALTVAGRYDNYSDFGGTFNPQYGIIGEIGESLTFRASYGTGFRAPSLFELYWPELEVFGSSISDPRRNNEAVSHALVLGGNAELKPIAADSFTGGFVYEPASLTGFRVSASYWRVHLQDRVSQIVPAVLLANESMFPAHIVRAEPTPADVAMNLPGRLLAIRSTYLNFGHLDTSGIDLGLTHAIETRFGRFSGNLSGTWVRKFIASSVPGARAQDRVGIASLIEGTIPEWRTVATVAWARDGIGLAATARHAPGYEDVDAALGTAISRALPAQTFVDLQASVKVDERITQRSWLDGVSVTFGVSNVFDEGPTFAVAGGLSGYDVSQGDVRQRFGYVSASKSF